LLNLNLKGNNRNTLKISGYGVQHSESLGVKILSIAQNSNKLEITTFRISDMLSFSGVERQTSTLLVPLEIASLYHWTIVTSSLLGCQTMNKVIKPSDSQKEGLLFQATEVTVHLLRKVFWYKAEQHESVGTFT
jgi:hypothetical protein